MRCLNSENMSKSAAHSFTYSVKISTVFFFNETYQYDRTIDVDVFIKDNFKDTYEYFFANVANRSLTENLSSAIMII